MIKISDTTLYVHVLKWNVGWNGLMWLCMCKPSATQVANHKNWPPVLLCASVLTISSRLYSWAKKFMVPLLLCVNEKLCTPVECWCTIHALTNINNLDLESGSCTIPRLYSPKFRCAGNPRLASGIQILVTELSQHTSGWDMVLF